MVKNRPAPDYVTGPVTQGLRLASVLGIVVMTAYILWRYPSLPDVVPTHFDFTGQPDAGNRGNCSEGGANRPLGALNAAYQLRRRYADAFGQYGGGTVQHRQFGEFDYCPAPGTAALPALSAAGLAVA